MPSYLLQVPQGVVGDVTRPDESNIEPCFLGATPPVVYGCPVKYDSSGNIIAIAASDAATVFAGILTRQAPAEGATTESGNFNSGIPNALQIQGLMVRGYCSVICTIGTPVRGGIVYMRITAASGKFVGDLEATFDSGNNVALSDVEWAISGKDSNNITELRVAQ